MQSPHPSRNSSCHRRTVGKIFLLVCLSMILSIVTAWNLHSSITTQRPSFHRPVSSALYSTVVSQSQSQSQSKPSLVPEGNPMADPNAVSVAGVRYADVLESIQELFPPEQLQQRNAMSRTDGYWPFLSEGSEPPVELTYGEFDFYFFAELLDRAHSHFVADSYPQSTAATDWRDKVFVDIGSGTGRLVLSAAALHPGFKQCRGVELLESIHNVAVENLDKCRSSVAANPGAAPSPHHSYAYQTYADSLSNTAAANDPVSLESGSLPLPAGGDGTKKPSPDHRLAPIYFVCGSFEDPYINMGDADCIFVFSSCYLEDTMEKLGKAIGRQCRPGTIVITTERALPLRGNSDPIDSDPQVPYGPFEVQVVDQVQGYCWLTGGESTAFIHKVVSSQWSPVPVTRPL